ncbi:F-box domain-containing protein [Artemisia annua]|uniref:F-box domain-containing protein n=1 Tax=Artemisia annua TaxID=35608 RepID=A0A2U1N6Q3_ARTAN|nr:F-box domain-containing protein [Artemisia annua]
MGSSSSKPREVMSAESRRSVSRNVFQDNCIINKSSSSFNGIDVNDDVTHDDDEHVKWEGEGEREGGNGTNSWSEIVSATPKVYYARFDSSACFFKGTLHWVVQCGQCCIITFDLSTNVFGFISVPKPDSEYFAPMIIKGCLAVIFVSRDGGEHCSIWVMREYNNVASWTKAFDILEGILMNEGHKDSISYNHETGTRSRLVVDSCYTVDMDMCIESLELFDKEIVRDESYFLVRHYHMY